MFNNEGGTASQGGSDGGTTGSGASSTGGAATGGSSTGGAATGGSGTGGAATGGSSTGGAAAGGTGGQGGAGGSDPCDLHCGATELCAPAGAGVDDDCDGQVDEGCPCVPGTAQACFRGDPTLRDAPGCHPGSQRCTESGTWDSCVGGLHASDGCDSADLSGCHPLETLPLVPVDLKDGTGTFSNDAVTETWSVFCPPGVSPCPWVSGSPVQDDFQPLQSGEYLVTYTKTTINTVAQCSYPLFVRGPGLRVELQWEWDDSLGPQTVDLDLHLHQPGDTTPWGGNTGTAEVCAWDNCTVAACAANQCPAWFNGVVPPDPMDWYLDPVFEQNTCYFGIKGSGAQWQALGLGCHNPRLDADNVNCDPTVTDPQANQFCNIENTNIDLPPSSQWTRLGVHYYSNHNQSYPVHPTVKVFCHGELAAELGPSGYYVPEAPVTFAPADSSSRFWLVADVVFQDDSCGVSRCQVEPLVDDPSTRAPLLTTVNGVQQSFGPPYPPLP